MPIIGQRVTSVTEQPSSGELDRGQRRRRVLQVVDHEHAALRRDLVPVTTSSHVTQFPVSQPGERRAVWPCQPSAR